MGGKVPIVQGALLGWVIVPFMKMEPPYEELLDLLNNVFEWWDENGKMRERLGELILRHGHEQVPQGHEPQARPSDGQAAARQSVLLLARGGEVEWLPELISDLPTTGRCSRP